MIGKDDGRLTEDGKKVAECPVDVSVARMVRIVAMFMKDFLKLMVIRSCWLREIFRVERKS
ncbi:hypothetical protein BDV98DRAFT_564627 [Pterulicium gracile]|uniref:Uncharacterized protein n=1 Tax=Pterulicium gracile TaxID=1884261 RepID=A0A5C3QNY4_9AGAR|nr:hypothetical protein BDV98DRAFT_564627 [Pterula gracilis]